MHQIKIHRKLDPQKSKLIKCCLSACNDLLLIQTTKQIISFNLLTEQYQLHFKAEDNKSIKNILLSENSSNNPFSIELSSTSQKITEIIEDDIEFPKKDNENYRFKDTSHKFTSQYSLSTSGKYEIIIFQQDFTEEIANSDLTLEQINNAVLAQQNDQEYPKIVITFDEANWKINVNYVAQAEPVEVIQSIQAQVIQPEPTLLQRAARFVSEHPTAVAVAGDIVVTAAILYAGPTATYNAAKNKLKGWWNGKK